MKERLAEAQKKSAEEKSKWETKLHKLDLELSSSKDCIFAEKSKCHTLIAKQVAETQRVETKLRNYAETIEEERQEMYLSLKSAISEKKAAERGSKKYKALANERLDKWHNERQLRRDAEDFAASQQKATKQMQVIIEEHTTLANQT